MIDLKNLTIKEARAGLDSQKFSAVELAQSYLDEIKKQNTNLNAYLEVFSDVLEQAKTADERIAKGESMPLLGIPFAVKDNILIKGRRVGAASKILENYTATYDATVIAKLRSQGAVFLGRTNMDEFALGSSTENSAYGVTHNPFDLERVSGGTSGGSAASVASNMTLVALGSDTGGSVRQPSSFCGVVGLKPTYGGVSRSGLIAATSSFDQIGPIGKSVSDVETVFNVIRGQDPLDSTTIPNYELVKKDDTKLKVGVPWSLVNSEGVDAVVRDSFNKSIETMKSFGYEIVDVSLPNMLAVYYILNFAEVSSNLARFDGVKYGHHVDGKNLLEDYMLSRGTGFGKEARRRIILGTYVLSSGYYDAYYGKAQLAQAHMRGEFEKIFQTVDCIATPTAPTPAWKIGEKNDPLAMYLEDIFTVTANIVGLPAISLPSGFAVVGDKNLPLGIQIMAPHKSESLLFSVGKKFLKE